jgi:hypothetical protein
MNAPSARGTRRPRHARGAWRGAGVDLGSRDGVYDLQSVRLLSGSEGALPGEFATARSQSVSPETGGKPDLRGPAAFR